MITGSQMRAARAVLRWSLEDLARESGVSMSTIRRAEADEGTLTVTVPNQRAIRTAFQSAGIEFIGTPDDGPGIRIRPPKQQDPQ